MAGYDQPLLTAAALYGANASGKSNVLDALAFMQEAVIFSHRVWEPGTSATRTRSSSASTSKGRTSSSSTSRVRTHFSFRPPSSTVTGSYGPCMTGFEPCPLPRRGGGGGGCTRTTLRQCCPPTASSRSRICSVRPTSVSSTEERRIRTVRRGLVHFRDSPGMQHRDDLQEMMKACIDGYHKHLDFEEFAPRYHTARDRARQMQEKADEDGEPHRNPTTGVYHLTEIHCPKRRRIWWRFWWRSTGIPARPDALARGLALRDHPLRTPTTRGTGSWCRLAVTEFGSLTPTRTRNGRPGRRARDRR